MIYLNIVNCIVIDLNVFACSALCFPADVSEMIMRLFLHVTIKRRCYDGHFCRLASTAVSAFFVAGLGWVCFPFLSSP